MEKETIPVPIANERKRKKFRLKNPIDQYPVTKIVDSKQGMKAVLMDVKVTKLFPPEIFWSCYECTRKISNENEWTYDTIIAPENPCPKCGRN